MMKRILPLFMMAILWWSCGQKDRGGSTVQLRIDGAGGQMAYFDRNEHNRMYHVDSVKLGSNGEGTMHLPPLPMDFYRISVGGEEVVVALDSTENLTLHAQAGSLGQPSHIEGSTTTQRLHGYFAEQQEFEDRRGQLRELIQKEPGNGDHIRELNELNARQYESTKKFAQENSGSPAALSAAARLDMDKEFELHKQLRDDLRKVMPRSSYFAQYRQRVDQHEQQLLAIRLQEEEMKRLSGLLPIGSQAPEIRQQTPEGGTYGLSDMRGKVVLIDFWASWCRPCRIENPAVKKVYEKYRKKGFEILGVSLDRDHGAWVNAIAQDGLPWKHVSDLGFWQNQAAQEYGVQSIPYTVLVDREGKIIEKGLRAHDLDARLAQLFGS